MRHRFAYLAIAFGILIITVVFWGVRSKTPQRPHIDWLRDGTAARDLSNSSCRPILIFVQSRTARFPAALTHPIVVDASKLFVMVMAEPEDVGKLTGYGNAASILPAGNMQLKDVLAEMVSALRAAGQEPPTYLQLVAMEHNPSSLGTRRFAVSCFWKAERDLAKLDGVLATRTGTIGTEEAVEVDFDPARLTEQTLRSRASNLACFRHEVLSTLKIEPADQQQHQLSLHPEYHFLPLTGLQASKVNSALAAHESPDRYLSPSQLSLKRRIEVVLRKDRMALFELEQHLKPDRSDGDLARYQATIEQRINDLEGTRFLTFTD